MDTNFCLFLNLMAVGSFVCYFHASGCLCCVIINNKLNLLPETSAPCMMIDGTGTLVFCSFLRPGMIILKLYVISYASINLSLTELHSLSATYHCSSTVRITHIHKHDFNVKVILLEFG